MIRFSTFTLICLLVIFTSYIPANNQSSIEGIIIDPTIKDSVEKLITKSEFEFNEQSQISVYNNKVFAEIFENDKLAVSTYDNPPSLVFKSFYYLKTDSLFIDGAFGLFTGMGFTISIANKKATLAHMLTSDETPGYAYNEKSALLFRINVPCIDTKIILSELPDPAKKTTIYGYVEFKSKDYYSSSGSADGKEILPRSKNRANMKIYFKSNFLPLD